MKAFADDNFAVAQMMQWRNFPLIGWKTLLEQEKCWFIPAFPFPIMFSKKESFLWGRGRVVKITLFGEGPNIFLGIFDFLAL